MNEKKNGHITAWPLGALLRFMLVIMGELKSLIVLFILGYVYVTLVYKFATHHNIWLSLLRTGLWFMGESYGLPGGTTTELICFLGSKLLGYFFFGLVLYIILTSFKGMATAIEKGETKGTGKNITTPSFQEGFDLLFKWKSDIKYTKMNNKKRLRFIIAGLIILIGWPFLPGCFSGGNKPATDTIFVRAAELPISYSAVTHIANEKGYIAGENLPYKVISVPAGPDIVNALRGGGDKAVELGSIAVTPIITMIGAGLEPIVLATTMQSDVNVQLITYRKSGITADPRTLRHKKVGFVGNTVGEIYLSRLLRKVGMTEKDIIAVNGRPADLKSLLQRGGIDAAILWDPFVAQVLRDKEAQPVVYVDTGLYHLTFNIVTTKEKLAQHRAEFQKFLRACIKSGDFMTAQPDSARQLLEKWLNLGDGDLSAFVRSTSFKVALDIPQLKKDMQTELEWLKQRQPGTIIPADLSKYIDASLLKEIDPNLVKE